MAIYQIYANVDAQNIAIDLGDVQLVSGSNDIYQVSFTFSDEWDSFAKKVVFYTEWKKSIIEILLSGTNIVTIPTRSLANPGILMIGVYGTGTNNEKFPTVWSQKIHIYEGTCQGYENPPAPDPDVYAEILAAMAGKQDILTWDETPTAGSNNPVKSKGIKAALETKADTNGIYPELVAGSAEQLLSQNYTADNAPYLYRANPYKSNRVKESIIGGSVAWNQLAPEEASAWTKRQTTLALADGVYTLTSNSNSTTAKEATVTLKENHVYLYSGTLLTSNASYPAIYGFYAQSNHAVLDDVRTESTTFETLAKVYKPTVASYFGMRVQNAAPSGTTVEFKNLICTDLTAMFPPAIVDYVWTLEQATAGSGIAWLKSYGFFTEPYYAYDAGSIQSVSTDKKKVVGFNAWDEEWEGGAYRTTTGAKVSDSNRMRCKNPIRVIPNSAYYFNLPYNVSSYGFLLYRYDADMNYLGYETVYTKAKTIPSDTHYINFVTQPTYGTTYKNDICINLSDPAKNGTYEPYQSTSYTLDHDSLNGIPKLDANYNLYYDGDVRKAVGQTERKYTLVDLGTRNWTYSSTNQYFYSDNVENMPSVATSGQSVNWLSTTGYNLVESANENGWASVADKSIGIRSGTNYVCVKDSAYTDAPTFKTAMSGKYLLYEVATPVTETSTPFPSIENIFANGTEEFTDYLVSQGTRDVSIPVGHESDYLEDSQAKLDGLPWNFASLIAPTEATYTATRNYASGDYLIVNNTLYKVTSAIANGGTITVGTNVTATTLTAEILAL